MKDESMMRNLIIFGAAILLVGCTTEQPKDQFKLNGTIQGVDGKEIYLAYQLNDTISLVDTTMVQDGTFTFSGILTKPAVGASLWMGDRKEYQNKLRAGIYLEPALMTIVLDTIQFANPVMTGSVSQAEAESFSKALAVLDRKAEDYREKMTEVYMDFLRNHPNSFVAANKMAYMMHGMAYEEIKAAYDLFTPRIKQSGVLAKVEKEIAALERVLPGKTAPDFVTIDIHGQSIRFSEAVKNKYVILDFWASWCVPCRKSSPHVKELYNKYKDKELVVFCVADNDGNEEEWHKAIEKDGLQEFFHVLRGLKVVDRKKIKFDKTNDISDKYAVHYLPTKYLIDKDFKIVGKFNDAELDAKLKEIFGE